MDPLWREFGVKSTKFLGVHLAENFTWSLNTTSISKKDQQRLYVLRRLRKAHLPPPILTMFYRGTIESFLSSCITAWFGNCTVSDRKTLQRILRTAEKIIGVSLPSITDMYTTRCIRKANSIVDDPTHPSHTHPSHPPHTHSSPSCRLERENIIQQPSEPPQPHHMDIKLDTGDDDYNVEDDEDGDGEGDDDEDGDGETDKDDDGDDNDNDEDDENGDNDDVDDVMCSADPPHPHSHFPLCLSSFRARSLSITAAAASASPPPQPRSPP
ncbi:hypothetical protein QTP86_030026 [Hemibagrus guttatus]|nr:hypothetical protein QTP86_030026 [Hemibagrus guttatus]